MKVFHHNDLDGRCAGAVVAWFTRERNQEDYFEVDYIKPLPLEVIQPKETVYLVDYSFKADTAWQLDEILKKTSDVVWIDHHTSSLNLLQMSGSERYRDVQGLREDGISGAALTWMWFTKCSLEETPFSVQLVSDYDCWKNNLGPDTTNFKLGIDAMKHDALDSIWKSLFAHPQAADIYTMVIISNGQTIKTYVDQDNAAYCKEWGYESEIAGYPCFVINRKSNSWIFGEKYKQYPVVVVWAFNGTKYSYSLYSSDKNVDCSKIAEQYGGGGHKGAAGFSSDKLLLITK